MSKTEIDAIISMLGGDEDSVAILVASLNKTIATLGFTTGGGTDALHFEFEDGSKIRIFDDAQHCCEKRYMVFDDDLAPFVGAKLTGLLVKRAPDVGDCDGVHDVAFLEVQTDRGVFTCASHNEHNGYYGGFSIHCAKE